MEGTIWYQTFGFRNCEAIYFCCSQLPSFGCIASGVLGNKYTALISDIDAHPVTSETRQDSKGMKRCPQKQANAAQSVDREACLESRGFTERSAPDWTF